MRVNKILHKNYVLILLVILFVLVRIPDLGHDNFNTDVWKWKKRIFDFSSGVFNLKPQETVQTYHPGVTLMWLGTLGVKVHNLIKDIDNKGVDYPELREIFQLDFIQKLLIVLAIGIGFYFLLVGLSRSLSSTYALIFGVLLTFEPFFVALSRVIHLEGLTTTFLFTSLVWLYLYGKEDRFSYLLISGVFGALSVLTKSTALFILPFSFLYLLVFIKRPRSLIIWFTTFMVTSLLIWPALVFKPLYVIEYLYKGVSEVGIEDGHAQYYFGKYVEDPGVTFYPVVLAYKSTPIIVLGFFLGIFAYKGLELNQKKFLKYLLVFFFLYLLEITIPTKKLDRYSLPLLFSMIGITALVIEYIIFKRLNSYKTKIFVICFIASISILTILRIHPDYFSYYSPMFGGLRFGVQIIEPKWLIGKDEIIDYLNEVKVTYNLETFKPGENIENLLYKPELSSKLTVAFPEKYYTQIHPFVREIGGWAVIEDLSGQAIKTNFFIYPVWDDYSAGETRFKLEYLDDIQIDGVSVYRVYRRVS